MGALANLRLPLFSSVETRGTTATSVRVWDGARVQLLRLRRPALAPTIQDFNGIKHLLRDSSRVVPPACKIKSINEKFKTEDFAIFDRSEQALANCTAIQMLQDSFMQKTDIRKRYLRFCAPSPDHNLYGETDRNRLYLLSEPVLGLEIRNELILNINLLFLPGWFMQGAVQCLDGILRTVDVYSQWAFGVEAQTIFQTLLEEGKNCPGDNGRYEIKLNLLPEVTERLKDEDDGHFYYRHAGRAWLIIDAHNVPSSLFQVFELTDVGSILIPSMASLLFGDTREKTVQRQDPHTDKRLQDKVQQSQCWNQFQLSQ